MSFPRLFLSSGKIATAFGGSGKRKKTNGIRNGTLLQNLARLNVFSDHTELIVSKSVSKVSKANFEACCVTCRFVM